MFPSQPNWTPVTPSPIIKEDIPECARCFHRASSHRSPTSCSVRGRWRRRCKCSGYTRPDFPAQPAS